MITTSNLGLQIPEENDIYDIGYVKYNMLIVDAILNEEAIEEAFYAVFTETQTSETDATALDENDILEAINTTWNGESSDDTTALSATDVEEAVTTQWNGESSEDETALSATDVEDATSK